jgi:ABC-type multidrug transport system fused ATPase/permease subunit
MRFLDLECKSPLYTHIGETFEGLSTIRAFGWQEEFMKINIKHLDTSQKPSYLMSCIQRWLGLVLQLLVAVTAVIVVALATSLIGTTSGGRLGISLSQIVTFPSSLSFLLMFWTQMETCLGAIARLKGFQEGTKPEDRPEETFIPGEDWPSKGAIEFKNVCASYGWV